MNARRARILRWVLATLGVLGLLVAASVWWMVQTERGAKWAFERLGAALPGTLDVGEVIGSIGGPLEVRDVSYKSERLQVTMDRLWIGWSLKALLLERLDVHRLEADNVRILMAQAGEKVANPETLTTLPDVHLPLDIMIQDGLVRGLRIVSTGADSTARPDTAIALDRVTMHALAFRDTLSIGSLALRSALGQIELHGGGRTHSGYRVNLALDWVLHPPGRATLTGHGSVIGSMDTVAVLQTIAAPLRSELRVMVYEPVRDMNVDGRLALVDLDAHGFDQSLPAAHVSGDVAFRGRPEDLRTRAALAAATQQWGRLTLDADLDRKKDMLRVLRLALRTERGGSLEAQGSVPIGGAARELALDARWQKLAWPLRGTPFVTSDHGTARVGGTVDRYRIAVDAQATIAQIPASPVVFTASGDSRGLDFAALRALVLGGAVTGSGQVRWSPAATWQFTLAGSGIDPGTRWPALHGAVAFDATTQGRVTRAGPIGTIQVPRFGGTLGGQPLSGRADLALAGSTTRIRTLDVALGPDRLMAEGEIGVTDSLSFDLHAPSLAVVMPRAYGTLDAQGTVSGPGRAPRIVAKASGDSLRFGSFGLDRLAAAADLDLAPQGVMKVTADGERVRLPARRLDHVGVRAEGTRAQHRLEITARAPGDSLDAAFDGGLLGTEWRGTLSRLDLDTRRRGRWSLDHPAPLVASGAQAALQDFCWSSSGSRFCASGTWAKLGGWTASARLENIQLALLRPMFPPTLGVQGALNGTLDFQGGNDRVQGDARLAIGPGQIRYPDGNGRRKTQAFDSSTVVFHADASGARATAGMRFPGAGTVQAALEFPGFRPSRLAAGTQPLKGTMNVRMSDLGLVQAFVPDLTATRGTLTADLALSGTVKRPQVAGDLRLADGATKVPALGLDLRQIAFDARSDADGNVTLRGGLTSGSGRLTLDGAARILPNGVQRADATVAGVNVTAADMPDLSMLVSPDLHLAMTPDSALVTGEVVVPRADIRTKAESNPMISPTPDVVYANRDSGQVHKPPLALHATVRLVLGDDVRVRGYGLDAKPTGSVLAVQQPGRPLTGSGVLLVNDGTYKAYGQNLTIESGRLIYAGGPITNPGLDVRASRQAKDGVVAGFEVHGTLETPQLTVFSNPPMSDRDALAYVLLGHPLDKSSQNESGIMDQATSSLGLRGGDYVASTLARQLGLDEASVQSDSGTFKNASLMLGTYLSPRVYVNYGMGLLDKVSTLKIQYYVSHKWTLQASTGPQTSAEVLYTFEHGRRAKPKNVPPSPQQVTPDSARTAKAFKAR